MASYLTHINRYEDFNSNEDFEENDQKNSFSEEGLWQRLSSVFLQAPFIILHFSFANLVFFVIQVLTLEQVAHFPLFCCMRVVSLMFLSF